MNIRTQKVMKSPIFQMNDRAFINLAIKRASLALSYSIEQFNVVCVAHYITPEEMLLLMSKKQ